MKEDVLKMIWQLVDTNCHAMSQEEYYDMMRQLSEDAAIRAEGIAETMDNEPGFGDEIYH